MTDKVQKIKQEIERRIEDYQSRLIKLANSEYFGRWQEDEELLKFIDSLPEEPASEDLEEAASKYVREDFHERSRADFKAGAEWQKERDYLQYSHICLKDIKDAWQTLKKNKPDIESYPPICFMKGAEWQKQQDEKLFKEDSWNYIEENYPNITEEEKLRLYDISIKSRLAGANAVKQQMKETLQTEYEKGRFDMREEMMKDAQDAVVVIGSDGKLFAVPILVRLDEEVKNTKKVKLVIIDTNE